VFEPDTETPTPMAGLNRRSSRRTP